MAKIKIRRGLEASLVAGALTDGEIGFTTDTKEIYIGFGGINYQVGGAAALGDMLKSIYDTDNNGIVDWAENVNWTGVQGKPSTFAPPVASPSVLGGVKVGANLSVAADGVLSGNSIPESFIPKQERFTIAGGQTTFDLVKGYYTPDSLMWSIFGFQQPKESITEVTSTRFSIPIGLPNGTEFEVQYIQTVNLVPFPYHKTEHLPGGVDDLGLKPVALSGSYDDLTSKPTSLPANGGNADTVDGFHASQTAGSASTAVVRNSSGYIMNTWYNSNRASESSAAAQYVYDTGDGYMRKKDLANVKAEIVVASDVLTKIKTVDGSGSGLDADLLDSQEGSYYLSRANHTGTQLSSTISDFASTVSATVLAGLSTAANAVITATDTVLSALGKLQKQISDNLTTLTSHTSNTTNPHGVTKTQVGLSSVDNTSDASKPVSTAQQAALNLKANLASPALTGTPTAPTATTADNTTQVATTAFVKAQGYITSAGSGARITVATVAPSTPAPGDFWYKVI